MRNEKGQFIKGSSDTGFQKGHGRFRDKESYEKAGKKLSISNLGRKPTMLGKKHSEATKEKMRLSKLGDRNPAKRPEVREKIRKTLLGTRTGKDNHMWKGGYSIKAYSIDWTATLRMSIRERDKYVCKICGDKQGDYTFDVHHIDYDKKNCNPINLITLCKSCHSKTNARRKYWKQYFQNLIF